MIDDPVDPVELDDLPACPFGDENRKKKVNSKKKGNRWELQVCKLLGDAFDDEFRRVPMSGLFCGGP